MKKDITIKDDHTRSFSVRARLKSFRYAFAGLREFFSGQHNAVIHLVMTIVAFSAAIFFDISRSEFLAIIIVAAMVWMAELFNTAIEQLADLVSKERRPAIKFIKDLSAAAVLICSIAALATGAIVFIPKILS